jgi:uncharacterized membrane protein
MDKSDEEGTIESVEEGMGLKNSLLFTPPEIFEQNEKIQKHSAERMIQMAEEQAAHRRKIELLKVETDIKLETDRLAAQIKSKEKSDFDARMGMFFAALIVMTAIIVGGLVAYYTNEWAGGSITTIGGLSVIIPSFIQGRNQ